MVGASGTHSPRAANRSLDDGFGGVFYSAVAEPKEFSFQCDGHNEEAAMAKDKF